MNPTNTDTGPSQSPPHPSSAPATAPEASSARKTIQPITDNLVIDPEPQPVRNEAAVRTDVASTSDGNAMQVPSGPPPKYPQYGPNQVNYGPAKTIEATTNESAGVGWIGVAVTIIGVFYIVSGVVLILMGALSLLSFNPIVVIVPWLFAALYIYLGKGLIRRDMTARTIVLALAWILMVGAVFGTISTAAMILPRVDSESGVLPLILIAQPLGIFIMELFTIVILSTKQARSLFTYRM